MVRISTVFDEVPSDNGSKKCKVFMVRGDEGYAHQTQSILEVTPCTNPTSSIEGYAVYIKYDVVNDIGSSKVVLMDNDEVLGIYDWSDTDSPTTIGSASSPAFYLGFGVEHNLYLKYKGNNKGLPSQSSKITIHEDFPTSYQTSVVLGSHSWTNNSLNIPFTLKQNNQTGSTTQGKDVFFYIDDVLLDTVTTNSSSTGTASLDASKIKDGINTVSIDVFYDGELSPYHGTLEVQKGQKLVISEYPSTFIKGANNTVKCLLTDFNDNPITNTSVSLMGSTESTNSSGIAEFTFTNITEGTYHASTSTTNSPDVSFRQTEVTDVTFAYSGVCTENNQITITGNINRTNNYPVPFTFEILDYSGNVEVSKTYNANGVSGRFTGKAGGYSTARITIQGLSPYTSHFYDYYAYANINSNVIQNVRINDGSSSPRVTSDGYMLPNKTSSGVYYSKITSLVSNGNFNFLCTVNYTVRGKLQVVTRRGSSTYTDDIYTDYTQLKGAFRLQRYNNSIRVYRDNTLVTTIDYPNINGVDEVGLLFKPYNQQNVIVSSLECYKGSGS